MSLLTFGKDLLKCEQLLSTLDKGPKRGSLVPVAVKSEARREQGSSSNFTRLNQLIYRSPPLSSTKGEEADNGKAHMLY